MHPTALPTSRTELRRSLVIVEGQAPREQIQSSGHADLLLDPPIGGVFPAHVRVAGGLDLGPLLARTLTSLAPPVAVVLGLVERVLTDLQAVHEAGSAHGALELAGWGFDAEGRFVVRPSVEGAAPAGQPQESDVQAIGGIVAELVPNEPRLQYWLRGTGAGGGRVSFADARSARQALLAVIGRTGVDAALRRWLDGVGARLPDAVDRGRIRVAPRAPAPVPVARTDEASARRWVERELARLREEEGERVAAEVQRGATDRLRVRVRRGLEVAEARGGRLPGGESEPQVLPPSGGGAPEGRRGAADTEAGGGRPGLPVGEAAILEVASVARAAHDGGMGGSESKSEPPANPVRMVEPAPRPISQGLRVVRPAASGIAGIVEVVSSAVLADDEGAGVVGSVEPLGRELLSPERPGASGGAVRPSPVRIAIARIELQAAAPALVEDDMADGEPEVVEPARGVVAVPVEEPVGSGLAHTETQSTQRDGETEEVRQPFSPDAGASPENGFISEPFSPDVGTSPENGFISEPFSPDVGTSPENGFISEPFSPDAASPSENGFVSEPTLAVRPVTVNPVPVEAVVAVPVVVEAVAVEAVAEHLAAAPVAVEPVVAAVPVEPVVAAVAPEPVAVEPVPAAAAADSVVVEPVTVDPVDPVAIEPVPVAVPDTAALVVEPVTVDPVAIEPAPAPAPVAAAPVAAEPVASGLGHTEAQSTQRDADTLEVPLCASVPLCETASPSAVEPVAVAADPLVAVAAVAADPVPVAAAVPIAAAAVPIAAAAVPIAAAAVPIAAAAVPIAAAAVPIAAAAVPIAAVAVAAVEPVAVEPVAVEPVAVVEPVAAVEAVAVAGAVAVVEAVAVPVADYPAGAALPDLPDLMQSRSARLITEPTPRDSPWTAPEDGTEVRLPRLVGEDSGMGLLDPSVVAVFERSEVLGRGTSTMPLPRRAPEPTHEAPPARGPVLTPRPDEFEEPGDVFARPPGVDASPMWASAAGVSANSDRGHEKGQGKWTESGRDPGELASQLPAGPSRPLRLDDPAPRAGLGWVVVGIVLLLVFAMAVALWPS